MLRVTTRLVFLGLLCVFLVPASASADFLPNDNISIGLESNPIEIPYDPEAPPWQKIIDDPEVPLWADDAYDFVPTPGDPGLLTVINLEEWLVIGGTNQWTDWHEEIVGAAGTGWVFDRPSLNLGLPGVSGPVLEVKKPGESGFNLPDGYLADAQDQTIDFYFDQLPVGTEIHIIKRLVYLGSDYQFNTQPPDQWIGPLVIEEWPTIPEPETLTLTIATVLLAMGRRRF